MSMLIIYVLSFGSVAVFAYGAHRVIKDIQQVPLEDEAWLGEADKSSLRKNPLYNLMMVVVRVLARLNVNWSLSGYESMLRRRLDAAGRPWDLKPTEYMAIKEMTALVCAVLAAILGLAISRFSLVAVFLLGTVGFFLPNLVIARLVKERQLTILRDLPFCCDLLTLSVEAGLDFGSALERVVTSGPPGPLLDEMYMVVQETKIGKTRREAFVDFSERVQMQEISNFVGAIIQADRMGTGFASVLRVQSSQIRNSRFERAEKAAQKVPVKILFPIIIANLVSIAVILIIPLISTIMQVSF